MTKAREEYVRLFDKAPKNRKGKCYLLAGQYVMDHRDSVLVHGVASFMTVVDMPFDHAWVELVNGKIWEPITRMTMTAKQWESIGRPVYWAKEYDSWAGQPMKYDWDALRERILTEETWGPWFPSRALGDD